MGLRDKVEPPLEKQMASVALASASSKGTEKVVYLTPNETQFLLSILGETSIKVKDIEFVFHLVVKLQNHYLAITNTE